MEAQQATEQAVAPSVEPATDGRLSENPVGRTVRSIGHGGTFVTDAKPDAETDPRTSVATLLPKTERAVLRDVEHGRFDATTAFDYLFRGLRAEFPQRHLPVDDAATIATVVTALKRLGASMIEPAQPDADHDSTVPAVYTYWGQFIDHDITLNTNGPDERGSHRRSNRGDLALGDIVADPFAVFEPDEVVRSLHNGRHPMLNLDSLYGSGPRFLGEAGYRTTRSEASYVPDSPKLALGRIPAEPVVIEIPGRDPIRFELVAPEEDRQRDLPRNVEADDDAARRQARIPDARNDENLIVAQFHLAMIRFHNAVVDWVRRTEPWLAVDDRAVFDRAQQLVRYHYQWLVVNDYLRTLTKPGVLDSVLHAHSLLYRPSRRISMPLEFAVAAFRFGHSMVRNTYDFNVNFTGGRAATLVQLFEFTGGGGLAPSGAPPAQQLPSNWPIDWTRFVDKGDARRFRGARKIDPFLAAGLGDMLKEGNDATGGIKALLKQLAQRNLLRGYMLALPTGEDVATALRTAPLTFDQLTAGAADETVQALRSIHDTAGRPATPLWYYVLKEAEAQGNGNFLGEVGSRILSETFLYLLRQDDDSFMNASGGWSPANGVHFEDGRMITTLTELLRFAGVHPLPDGSFRREDGAIAGHDGVA